MKDTQFKRKDTKFRSRIFGLVFLAFLWAYTPIALANNFPDSLNNWQEGDIISEDWANALEAKVGATLSAVTTSLDYMVRNILPTQLEAVDSPADEECATYEATGAAIEWQTCAGISLAGAYDYITIAGNTITRNQIDLSTDVTGTLDESLIDADIARDSELHSAVTLAGEDYASLVGQQITFNSIDPDNFSATDFGGFTCNGTTCSLDIALEGSKWATSTGTTITPNGGGGIFVFASSTIGGGTQITGLTIAGGATTTGNAYFAGNVGVGTNAPSYKLFVAEDINAASFHDEGQLAVGGATNGNKNTTIGFDTTDDYGYIQAHELDVSTRPLILNPGGGNIGITDSNPDYKFELQTSSGSGYFGITNSLDGDIFSVNSSGNVGIASTTPYAKLSVTNTGSAPSFIVEDDTSPDGSPFIIDESGNVGIGTTTLPSGNELTLNGDLAILREDSGQRVFNMNCSSNGCDYDVSNSNGRHVFTVSGTERMRLSGDNLGIGTNVPDARLHVQDTSTAITELTGTMALFSNISSVADISRVGIIGGTSGNSSLDFADTDDLDIGRINYSHTLNALSLYTDNAERLTIDSNGDVGIGTTSPGSKLSIQGNIFLAGNLLSTSTASSTFAGGLVATCFSTDGTNCITGGSGTSASSTLLSDNNTFSGNNTFSNTITGSISGNAGTASLLQTARNINGVSFNGSADITINAASSTLLANNNTWTGENVFGKATTTSLFSTVASTSDLAVSGTFRFFTQVWTSLAEFSTYIFSLFSGGTGITFTNGDISFDCSEVEGTGINCSGENITLDATGDWSGTFDSQQGTFYLDRANHTGTQGASTVIGGTFGAGDFTFPSNLLITGSATSTNFFATTASSTNLFASLLKVDGGTLGVFSSHRVGIGSSTPMSKLGISGTTTTHTLNVQNPTHVGTSTLFLYSDTANFGGEIILEDSDGAGCTSITALNGTISGATVTCPDLPLAN